MGFIILIILSVAFLMIMAALYVAVRSQVFGTSPSEEFHELCMNTLDRHVYKVANKNRITMLLAEKGSETSDYIKAYIDVEDHVYQKYLCELEKEGRIERLPNGGRADVYKLCD